MALPLACPAAMEVSPPAHGPSVRCGVLELSNEGAHAHGFQSRGKVPALMSGRHDARTVHGFCAGPGVPGSRLSYCSCAIWRAQREAEWAARRGQDALRDSEATRPPAIDRDLLADAADG
jgi:hypothetical protein